MKITIVERKPFTINNPLTDKLINGYGYGGFTENRDIITFTSGKKYEVAEGATQYDENRSVDIILKAKFWDSKVKWQEAGSFGDKQTN